MKNQYFGDVRDLFKFDMAEFILNSGSGCTQLFYIPMLTPNDNTNHGNNRNYQRASAGRANQSLITFFQTHAADRRNRNIAKINDYFAHKKLSCDIFKPTSFFSHTSRELYIRQLSSQLPEKSLILIDPDIGLEPQTSSEKHIRYFELWWLHQQMDSQSAIMLIQFFNFQNRNPMFADELNRLQAVLDLNPLTITDNQIAFFFLPKDKSKRSGWERVLSQYKEHNPLLAVM